MTDDLETCLEQATTMLWFVFDQNPERGFHDPLWVLKHTDTNKEVAEAAYNKIDCQHKALIKWDVLDGIKVARADIDQAMWIDWDQVGFRAFSNAEDIAWDVAVAVREFHKDGFLFK